MSKRIERKDIAEEGVLNNLLEPLKVLIGSLDEADKKLKSFADTVKNSVKSADDAKGMRELEQSTQAVNKAFNDKLEIDKQREKLTKDIEKAEAKLVLMQDEEYKKLQELKKAQREQNKALKDGDDAYKKLSKSVRDAKNQSKTLGAELLALEKSGQKNTKAYKDLAKQYEQVTRTAQQGDKQLKKLDKTVGDNFRNVGNYEKATRGLSKALGALGVAFGVSQVVRNVTGIIADFDQAVTDLSAISGKTAEELEPLNKQAKELGATTQFSATQVTGLQIELAKLGFTTQEIMDSTGGIANFAAATGVEIPRAAALAGSSLRAFGLDATEIDRVVSTLGVATTKTALDFSQLETGISTVAPVATAFGFSIEDTTALLGQLSNAGFDASSSATATRNILLNLADANGDLAKELGRPIKSADDLASGLAELQAKGIDLASALELTDKRSVAAFQTFISGSDTLVELRDSITDVNDELTDMAEKRLDSVNGQLQLLASAWEGFILGTNEATSASIVFKNIIGFVAENLTKILGTLTRVGAYFLIYNQRARLAAAANFLFNGGLKNMITSIPKLIRGLKTASISFRGLGTAMKSIPFVAIIGLAIELFYWFGDLATQTRKLTDAEKARNDELERNIELENQRAKRVSSFIELQAKVNARQKLSQSQLKSLKSELEGQIATYDNLDLMLKAVDKELEENARLINASNAGIIELTSAEYLNAQQKANDLTRRREAINGQKRELENYEELKNMLGLINPLIQEETKVRNTNNQSNTEKVEILQEEVDLWEEYFKFLEKFRKEQDLLKIDNDAIFDETLGEAPILEMDEDNQEKIINNYKILFTEVKRLALDAYNNMADNAIDAFKRQEEAASNMYDALAQMASNGNITAQQSLAQQVKAQEDAQKAQMEMEQKKQKMQLISQGLDVFGSFIDAGDNPQVALGKTGVSMTSLIGLINSLPSFFVGTEDTGKNGKGVDGKGGFVSILHPNERVMTAEQNAMTKGLSNPMLADVAYQFKTGNLVPKSHDGSFAVVSELVALRKAVEEQPQMITGLEQTLSGMMKLVVSEKKGNHKNTNTYKS